jgi:cytochrome c oxidase assembly protein subunit 11
MQVTVGESGLAVYQARNMAARRTVGTATYNVSPAKAGPYFNKVQCFCFTEQQLAAGASVDMPVSFFVDPAIEDDPNLRDVKTITLSYTFFPDEQAAARLQLGELAVPPAIRTGATYRASIDSAAPQGTTWGAVEHTVLSGE